MLQKLVKIKSSHSQCMPWENTTDQELWETRTIHEKNATGNLRVFVYWRRRDFFMACTYSRGNIYPVRVLAKTLDSCQILQCWNPADIQAMVVDNSMFTKTTTSQLRSIYSFKMKTNLPAAVSWTPIGSDKYIYTSVRCTEQKHFCP